MDTTQQALAAAIARNVEYLAGTRTQVLEGDWETAVGTLGLLIPSELIGLQRRAVLMARQSGASWAGIGAAMSMTRQAAEQRFGAWTRQQMLLTTFALNQGEDDPRGSTCGLHDADGWDHPGAQCCVEAAEEHRALLAH